VKVVLPALVFIFMACTAFSSGIKDDGKTVETAYVKILGMVQVYGNAPRTFVGIVDENGTEYAVYPPALEDKLRDLQGHLIEFTVIFLDTPNAFGSLFLKGGTVEPVKWEIIDG